jgi:hypothetical protein
LHTLKQDGCITSLKIANWQWTLSLWLVCTLPTGRNELFWKLGQRRHWVNMTWFPSNPVESPSTIDFFQQSWRVFFHLHLSPPQTQAVISIFKAIQEIEGLIIREEIEIRPRDWTRTLLISLINFVTLVSCSLCLLFISLLFLLLMPWVARSFSSYGLGMLKLGLWLLLEVFLFYGCDFLVLSSIFMFAWLLINCLGRFRAETKL